MGKEYENIYELLKEKCQKTPHKEFVVFNNTRLNYGDFLVKVDELAGALYVLGLRKGDNVGIISKNCIEFLVIYFALGRLGASLIPVSPSLSLEEMMNLIKQTDVSMLFFQEDLINDLSLFYRHIKEKDICLKNIIHIGKEIEHVTSYSSLLKDSQDCLFYPMPLKSDEFVVVYSSGSSGKPKGASHSHQNIIVNAQAVVKRLGLHGDDIFLFAFQLYIMYGIGWIIIVLLSEAKIILMQEYSSVKAFKLIEKEKVTIHSWNKTMFVQELKDQTRSQYDLSSMRLGMIGGSVIEGRLIKEVKDKMNLTLCNCYGMTDAAGGVCLVNPDADKKEWLDTVGKPLDGVELKIFDDNQKELQTGEIGSIVCKGIFFTKMYYGYNGQFPPHYKNGWFYTGDCGYLDENGCLHVVGRKEQLIVRRGKTIALPEIENLISSCEFVDRVAVIATFEEEDVDPTIIAFVTLQLNAINTIEDVSTFCQQTLASSKQPDAFYILSEFPMTGTGKIDKRKLKKSIMSGQKIFLFA